MTKSSYLLDVQYEKHCKNFGSTNFNTGWRYQKII